MIRSQDSRQCLHREMRGTQITSHKKDISLVIYRVRFSKAHVHERACQHFKHLLGCKFCTRDAKRTLKTWAERFQRTFNNSSRAGIVSHSSGVPNSQRRRAATQPETLNAHYEFIALVETKAAYICDWCRHFTTCAVRAEDYERVHLAPPWASWRLWATLWHTGTRTTRANQSNISSDLYSSSLPGALACYRVLTIALARTALLKPCTSRNRTSQHGTLPYTYKADFL
jgi:hypothetical protein